MSDEKKSAEDPQIDADTVKSNAPEVDAEIVGDETKSEGAAAGRIDEPQTSASDEPVTNEETSAGGDPEEAKRSPGLVLFVIFSIVSIVIFLGFMFQSNRAGKNAEPISAVEDPSGTRTSASTDSENGPATEPATDQVNAAASRPLTEDDNSSNPSLEAGASNVAQAAPPAIDEATTQANAIVSDNSEGANEAGPTSQTPATENDATEDAADLFAANPDRDAIDQPAVTGPRSAIAALQKQVSDQTSSEADEVAAAADKIGNVPVPASKGDAISDEAEAAATEVATAISGESANVGETVEGAIDEIEETAAAATDTTVLSPEEVTALASDGRATTTTGDADTVAKSIANVTAETDPVNAEPTATAANNSIAENTQKIAAAAENTGKIVNELETIKETLRLETDALNAAVSEGRQLTEQQAARITDLQQSLEQAIADRDERATAEISDLRTRLDKIQSGGADIPAARQAKASLALLALERAVDEGVPYADELDVLAGLAPDTASLDGLRASASTGAPTLSSLKAEFSPAVRNALAASDSSNPTGLMARISKLISVRPATPQPGQRPAAVISRAEAALEKDNLKSSVQELGSLEDGAANAFADWISKAQRRLDASNAIEELNELLLSDNSQ